MNLELDGKVALVTGSSRGIGAGIALGLASEGCDLILTGRDTAALSDIANTIRSKGRRASICIADLRQPSAATALVDLIQEDFGKLDILVNCAGAAKRGLFLELNDDDWADGFALKFFAHVRLSRAVWMLLQQSSRFGRHDRRHQRPYPARRLRNWQCRQCGASRVWQGAG